MPSYFHWHTSSLSIFKAQKGPSFLCMTVYQSLYRGSFLSKEHRRHLLHLSADASVICSAICSIIRHLLCVVLHGHDVPICSLSGSSAQDSIARPIDRGICNRRSAVTRQMPSSVMQRQGTNSCAQMYMTRPEYRSDSRHARN